MIVISHRGNVSGREPLFENDPDYILQAIKIGFDVEIDVWYNGSHYFLGHDSPQYKIDENFLRNERLWCHAKNMQAMAEMVSSGIHCFWHQTDDCTLTSRGHIWCFPGIKCSKGIIVHTESPNQSLEKIDCFGVCTDYPIYWQKLYDHQSSLV